ncbi:hypothetical protein GCM10019059_39680 [Camelimonas fluminis]|uniref:Uncharacterized protein n=1 Tax=Camelimonas fluminis TaxID=1576911 RepID=A0ABV7UEM3_9HYPH|nr:hypothetical protein [Camelimonas fluminis]GHE76497.1 hypothetical protein GCM10019059_39680 [Camelimonas fluminis]
MDEHRKNRLKKQLAIGGASLVLASAAYGLWSLAQQPATQKAALSPPPQQEPLFPQLPAEATRPATVVGDLQITPQSLSTGQITIGQGSYAGSFTLRALHRPVIIRKRCAAHTLR